MEKRKKRPTLAQIAEAAGVSIGTVSKALHQRDDIAQATREHIEQVMRDMGYLTADESTPSSGQKRPLNYHVFLDSDAAYGYEVLKGIDEALSTSPFRMSVSFTVHDAQYATNLLQEAIEAHIGGLLFVGHPFQLRELQKQHVPFVVVDYYATLDASMPSVATAHWAGSRAATQYLLQLGHTHIGLLSGPANSALSQSHLAGYRAALEEARMPFYPAFVRAGELSFQSGYQDARILLQLAPAPSALLASSDMQAAGIYRALYEQKIAIPEQISVIGFDDQPLASELSPALTSVRQSLVDMGRVAAHMLMRTIRGEQLQNFRVELPTQLIKRSSCAARK